ncbi:kit ligand-like [Xyrauchen texanus]|uniref:kit ligand-like n=1 Tax=Xyrauchen texanus TaxID=154827 RepID=UPI002241EF76|nr:kit ligand-like [Xyrauchen texanus]
MVSRTLKLLLSFHMKKSNIWICACVYLLLYIPVAAYSSEIGNPITDDIKKISLLKQNIPKDYKITLHYIPKEVSGMCWVKLNVFHLEVSLKGLMQKFGNISTNKDNIGTFVQILQEMRYHMGIGLEDSMLEFECHYIEEMWLTARYFEFVVDFFNTANSSREAKDCEPPACPTSTKTTVTTTTTVSTTSGKHTANERLNGSPDYTEKGVLIPKVVEYSLLSLLAIPLIAVVFLLFWKIKSSRNAPQTERGIEEGPALFSGEEANIPPLDAEISEKNRLNIIRAV